MISKEWREVLEHRSVRDKIGIPCSCAMCPPGTLNVVSELVQQGYLVWLDRAVVSELNVFADVYLLTPRGKSLCEDEGILQR